MTEQIINLIAQIVIAVVGLGVLTLISRARKALKKKTEEADATALDKLIYELVAAAEQQLKKDDPSGFARKQYVVDLLEQLGYAVNAELNARIEAAVFDLNLAQKNG